MSHLTGRYSRSHGEQLDYVYNATYFDDGTKIEWDAAIRFLTGQLVATPSGRFSLQDCAGNPEQYVRRMIEQHIDKLPAS